MRSEDFLVHVKAQVMSRDDNKGGWVPRGAGGMSIISLCRLPAARSSSQADVGSRELLIYGRRIADKSVTSTRRTPREETAGLPCSNAAKRRNPLKLAGVPKTNETTSAANRPKFTIL